MTSHIHSEKSESMMGRINKNYGYEYDLLCQCLSFFFWEEIHKIQQHDYVNMRFTFHDENILFDGLESFCVFSEFVLPRCDTGSVYISQGLLLWHNCGFHKTKDTSWTHRKDNADWVGSVLIGGAEVWTLDSLLNSDFSLPQAMLSVSTEYIINKCIIL